MVKSSAHGTDGAPLPGAQTGGQGPSVDRHGEPVVDPTRNVHDFVNAAVRRQDDLREMQTGYIEAIAHLRASHDRELRLAEAARIDAIRAVDKQAVDTAASAAQAAAHVLSTTVALTAEQQRTQVAAVATAAAVSLAAALEPMAKDIADLRRVQYEQQGQKASHAEERDQSNWAIGAAIAAASILVGIITLVIVVLLHNSNARPGGSGGSGGITPACSGVTVGQVCIK